MITFRFLTDLGLFLTNVPGTIFTYIIFCNIFIICVIISISGIILLSGHAKTLGCSLRKIGIFYLSFIAYTKDGCAATARSLYTGGKEICKFIISLFFKSNKPAIYIPNNMLSFIPFWFLNIDFSMLPDTPTGYHKFLLGILGFLLLTLWCFQRSQIIGYLISLHIIHNTQLVTKYPKLKPLINYFKTTSYIVLAWEVFFFIGMYIVVIGIIIKLLYFE
jgi:hypothetical protein